MKGRGQAQSSSSADSTSMGNRALVRGEVGFEEGDAVSKLKCKSVSPYLLEDEEGRDREWKDSAQGVIEKEEEIGKRNMMERLRDIVEVRKGELARKVGV